MNIAIVRAFVRLRQMLVSHERLARKLEEMEMSRNRDMAESEERKPWSGSLSHSLVPASYAESPLRLGDSRKIKLKIDGKRYDRAA